MDSNLSNLVAYHDANEKKSTENVLELMESNWKKPPLNFVKINVDFAAFTPLNAYGIGIIIRDDVRSFVPAWS